MLFLQHFCAFILNTVHTFYFKTYRYHIIIHFVPSFLSESIYVTTFNGLPIPCLNILLACSLPTNSCYSRSGKSKSLTLFRNLILGCVKICIYVFLAKKIEEAIKLSYGLRLLHEKVKDDEICQAKMTSFRNKFEQKPWNFHGLLSETIIIMRYAIYFHVCLLNIKDNISICFSWKKYYF